MKDITILISACGSPCIPGIIECFRFNGERNIRIVGIDMSYDPSINYLVDKYYKVPPVTDDDYCERILEICKIEKVDIYFPMISAEVTVISKNINKFHQLNVSVSAPSDSASMISNNKLKTYELLKKNNICTPNYYKVNTINDYIMGCKKLGYPEKPVCLKIVDGSGSRGIRIIDSTKSRYDIFVKEKPNSFYISYEEMLKILEEAPELHSMILLEYMPGNEYTVDALAKNGKVEYIVGRENIKSLMSIAQESIVKYDEEAYNIAEKIIKLLNYDGNIGFDFMRNEDEKPTLMDINPRITATVSVIAAAGVNLPYLRVKQILGEKTKQITKIHYGTRIKRRYGEIYTNENDKRINIKGEIVE